MISQQGRCFFLYSFDLLLIAISHRNVGTIMGQLLSSPSAGG